MKYVNLPIQAATVRAGLESNAAELVDCTGYVTDAVQETADSSVSIYTAELLEFASSHPEAMNLAAVEFGVSPKDYDDWTRYTEAVASLAWYDERSSGKRRSPGSSSSTRGRKPENEAARETDPRRV